MAGLRGAVGGRSVNRGPVGESGAILAENEAKPVVNSKPNQSEQAEAVTPPQAPDQALEVPSAMASPHFTESALARTRLTVHAQNFILATIVRGWTPFQTGVFVSIASATALGPIRQDFSGIEGVRPYDVRRAWPTIGRFFYLTNAGWILRDNDVVSAHLIPERKGRGPVRQWLDRLIAFWGRACVYCGNTVALLHVDHIIPVSKGGSDELVNLTLACPTCNIRKGAKTAAEFGFPDILERAARQ